MKVLGHEATIPQKNFNSQFNLLVSSRFVSYGSARFTCNVYILSIFRFCIILRDIDASQMKMHCRIFSFFDHQNTGQFKHLEQSLV